MSSTESETESQSQSFDFLYVQLEPRDRKLVDALERKLVGMVQAHGPLAAFAVWRFAETMTNGLKEEAYEQHLEGMMRGTIQVPS